MEEANQTKIPNSEQQATPLASPPPSSPVQSSGDLKPSNIISVIIAIFCLLAGAGQILTAISLAVFVLPQLKTLQDSLGTTQANFYLSYFALAMSIVFGCINIFFGIQILKKATHLLQSIIFLILSIVIQGFFVGAIILSVINPIYKAIGDAGTACTQEVKICPDGSAVGRTGPKCEFSPCPTSSKTDGTANWKTYTNNKYGFSFKYPKSWPVGEEDNAAYNTYSINLGNMTPDVSDGYQVSLFILNENIEKSKEQLTYSDPYLQNRIKEITTEKVGSVEVIKATTVFSQSNPPAERTSYQVLIPLSNTTIRLYGDISEKSTINQILSTFKFTDSNPTPTCMGRPACLDAEPRCLVPEPAGGWCPE